jgi:dTDP-4-amino-4,6-dideoxygalactose transaminase
MPEPPPTAGLPIRWRDFLPGTQRPLEDGLAEFLHQPAVQIECSGPASLIVLLTTLKRASSRRSVVIPAYTCPLVVFAIAHCGLKPVLCDLRRSHFDFCPQFLDQVVNDDTLAIIPTHLGGRVADLDCAVRIARQKGAWVIEDAAQALGARRGEQAAGTVGDAGFYSLAVGKGLTLFEGGVLVARDEGLRRLLRETSAEIAPYRILREIQRLVQLIGYTALYRPSVLRLSYGMPLRRALNKGDLIAATGDDFSARIPLHRVGAWRRAVGANALMRLPAFTAALAAQAEARIATLKTIPGLTVIDDVAGDCGAWPLLMILMPTEQTRDAALARLWTAGLGVSRMFIHALPDYGYLAAALGAADLPNARDFAARMLTVSNSLWLGAAAFDQICSVLRTVLA